MTSAAEAPSAEQVNHSDYYRPMIRLRRVIAGAMRQPLLGPFVLVLLAFALALLAIHGAGDEALEASLIAGVAAEPVVAMLVALLSRTRPDRLDGHRPTRAPPAERPPATRAAPARLGLVALRL